ncbi:MAG: hypothetical protein JWN57_2211 [Frankiales bacterium]|jgi:hypothetical protein|nr:hypothetical protein [Frankiales bacterium]
MCTHSPACPSAAAPDHDAARVSTTHPEQGWSLLCNGVVVFEDMGEILPDGSVVAAHRSLPRQRSPRHAVTAA